jgi:hypothetical protein
VETGVAISTTAATAFSVGANGKGGSYTVRYQGSTTATDSVVNPKGRVISAPALSNIAAGLLVGDGTVTNGQAEFAPGNTATNDVNATASTNALTGKTYYDATFAFWPDKEGTYSFVFFNDTNDNGYVDGSDTSATLTLTVGASIASITTAAQNSSSIVSGANGALVKITVKDANGTAVAPSAAEGITVSLTSNAKVAKVNNTAVTAASSYTLGSTDFDATGTAYINVTDATAETVTLSAAGSGSVPSTVAASALSLTFVASDGTVATNAGTLTPKSTSKFAGTGGTYTVAVGTVSTTFIGTASGASKVLKITITDTNGKLSGKSNAAWDYPVTSGTDSAISFAASNVSTTTSQGYSLGWRDADDVADQTLTVASAAINLSNGTVTLTPSTVSAVAGATVGIKALVKDQFGNALNGASISVTYSGRNVQTATTSLVTDANGYATFTYTDTAASTAGSTDTIQFSATPATGSGSKAASATVTYNAANAVSTVVMDTPNTTAGVANDSVSNKPINAGLDGASASTTSVTATVKNSAGGVLAGVPVTFTISGTGAAITSTTTTAYTDATGVATASVYGWIAGTYTITATAGGKTGTGTITFAQENAAYARTISATANGAVVTAVAKDRYGNPVKNVRIYAKIASGTGYFGTGVLSTYADTLADGTATFVVAGGASSVTVSNIGFDAAAGSQVGQTSAAAGKDVAGVNATAFTATTVGTATTAETGVGASFSAAGVSSATVDVNATGSSDAIDAANEATDAANAATDAANAAAEAADAATAAAQDAQAAVAALATQVASLIAGIKAQITTLTNLVIKIQKKVRA